jgi:hypothetical protein
MSGARLYNTEALKEVKAALADFTESVGQTLASVDADINRISQWLTQDRPAYWKREVRKCEDAVAHAQTDIMRKRIIAAPEPASVVEEQKVLNRARQRLAEAQRKLDNVRRWAPVWEREALLYKTACRGLTEASHRDIPAAAARLDAMMTSLEAYLRLAAPQGDSDRPVTADDETQTPDAAAAPQVPPEPLA